MNMPPAAQIMPMRTGRRSSFRRTLRRPGRSGLFSAGLMIRGSVCCESLMMPQAMVTKSMGMMGWIGVLCKVRRKIADADFAQHSGWE